MVWTRVWTGPFLTFLKLTDSVFFVTLRKSRGNGDKTHKNIIPIALHMEDNGIKNNNNVL